MSKIEQTKIPMDLNLVPNGVKIKLTKVSERDDAEVPNNIPVNDYRIGYVRESLLKPIVGMRYGLESVIEKNGESISPNHWFMTSEVVEIMKQWGFKLTEIGVTTKRKVIFKTLNSIYKIEEL